MKYTKRGEREDGRREKGEERKRGITFWSVSNSLSTAKLMIDLLLVNRDGGEAPEFLT